jgi:predicted phage tail protein
MNTANHETMSTILLSGSLAKLFGRTHQRLIGPTREAFTALSATIPGFQKFMNTSKARDLRSLYSWTKRT